MVFKTASFISVSLLLATCLPAQVGKTDVIIGSTRGTGAFVKGIKLVSQNLSTCKVVRSLAVNTVGSFEFSQNRVYGGATYDAVRGGVWLSHGIELTCVDPVNGKILCQTIRMPIRPRIKLSWFSFTASAMAFDNQENTLYVADAINGDLYQVKTGSATDPRACVFSDKSARVRQHMPASHTLTGLAIDQVRRLLFVGSQHMTTGKRHIYVTSLQKWDGKTAEVTGVGGKHPPLCPNSTTEALWLQGMAFDSARSILHVTDGRMNSAYTYTPTKQRITISSCCANPSSQKVDFYVSLALMPQRSTQTGSSCQSTACLSCPAMTLKTLGDAALGNSHFALALFGAPSNSTAAVAALGFGNCTSPGIDVGLCARLTVSLNALLPIALPVNKGIGNCGGTSILPLPIPADIRFFGTRLSAQFLTVCTGGQQLGHSLSNCVGFEITHN